jgi:hypothetical protein
MEQALKDIRLPSYEFTEFPALSNRGQVEASLNSLLQQTSKFAGIASIYARESGYYPGVGKLQVYYVLQDTADEYALKKGLVPHLQKLMGSSGVLDQVHFLNTSLFQHFDQIKPYPHLQHLHGPDTRFATLTPEYRDFCHLLAINDLILMSPLPQLANILAEGVIPVGSTWSIIENVTEILEAYSRLKGKVPTHWKEYPTRAKELAQNWFQMNLNKFQEYKELLRDSLRIMLEILDDMNKFIQRENLYFIQQSQPAENGMPAAPAGSEIADYRACFISDQVKALFIDRWTPELALKKMIALYRKKKEYCIYLPTLLSVPYVMYYKGIDYHSAFIQKSFLYHGFAANVSLPEVVNMRNKKLSEYLQFYESHRFLMEKAPWLGYAVDDPERWTKVFDRFFEKRRKEQHLKWLHATSLELART